MLRRFGSSDTRHGNREHFQGRFRKIYVRRMAITFKSTFDRYPSRSERDNCTEKAFKTTALIPYGDLQRFGYLTPTPISRVVPNAFSISPKTPVSLPVNVLSFDDAQLAKVAVRQHITGRSPSDDG